MIEAAARPAEPSRLAPPRELTFSPSDWEVLSRFWFPVAQVSEVGLKPLPVTLLDERLVIYRVEGKLLAARDLCVHRGTPLSLGWVEGGDIVCRYHGFRFGADGRCTHIPAHPDAAIPPRLAVTMFPVVEAYGLVWTSLNGTRPDIPDFPAWDDSDFQPILPPWIDIAGSAGRQMEGFLDVAHFAWVHEETFGDRNNPLVPSYKVERTPAGIHADYWSSVSNFPKGMQDKAPADFRWLRAFDVHLPFTARLTIHFPGADRLHIMNCASPVSARMTRLFVPVARNFDKDGPLEAVYDFNRRIFEEDRAIVEAQRPEDLPLDLTAEAHIQADRTSLAYRQGLSRLGLGRAYTA